MRAVVILLSLPVCWAGYPCEHGFNHAASTIVQIVFYCTTVTASVVLCAYYFAKGRTASTIIPCISAAWYRIYTVVLITLAGLLFVISAVETRQTPCGKYSKLPG
ncbi:hypothetical protein F5Y16DRAFT_59908 [Xylariaceae sp. FL0255]|nr:hypothetical protein F5Y16DRAFT_59908 [Xylariaceae sp. FL0255]